MSKTLLDQKLAALAAKAAAGRLNRRSFMQTALAMGLTIPAATRLWTRDVAAQTPKAGGHFRVALDDGNTTDSLDPATFQSRYMITMGPTYGNYLTEINSDNKVTGELAESWDVSPDAKTWTLKLRKGVEFHNGKTFDANDAAASLNYHRAADSKSGAAALFASVEEIKVDDPNTLTVKLSSGSADFPYVLTDYHLVILPADKEGKIDWASKIGSGGYVIESFEPGVKTVLKKFPNYWKQGRAHFDSVEFLAVTDVNARQTALISDAVDAMIECDFKTVDMLMQTPDIKVDEIPTGTHVSMPMHMDVAPFNNNDVRMALKYAIDREATIKTVLNGHGSIGNDHPIGPVMPYYNPNIPQTSLDPDKAKFHLKKAGMENLTIDLSAADTVIVGAVDMAVLFGETAKKAGINVNVIREPNDAYWANVWLKKPFCLSGWGQRPTPDIIFTLGYAAGAEWNDSHFKDEQFNKLLIEARAELDDAKRGEMYGEMQLIVHERGSVIVPFFRTWIYARRAKVQSEAKLTSSWPLDGARGAERWWFA